MPNCRTCGLYIPLQFLTGDRSPEAIDNSFRYLLSKADIVIERGMSPKTATKDIYLYWRAIEHSTGHEI